MLKFIEEHPYWTMLIMAVSTIVGFSITEWQYQMKVDKEYFESQKSDITGGILDEYKFDERV